MNKQQWDNAKYLNRVVHYDYESHMFQRDDVWYYKYGKNKKRAMLSFSTWLKAYNKIKLDGIPFQTLEQARIEGQALMFWLDYIWKNKIKDIGNLNYESQKIQEMVFGVIQCLIDNKFKIIAIEKHITNGFWHGYIDMIVKDKVGLISLIEIKTRSGFEVRDTDTLQLLLYKKIINFVGSCYVMVVDKITRTAKLFKQDTLRKFELLSNVVNRPLEALNMKEYAMYMHKKSGDIELYNTVKNSDLSYLRSNLLSNRKEINTKEKD